MKHRIDSILRTSCLLLLTITMCQGLRAQQAGTLREISLERCIVLAQSQSPEAMIAKKAFESVYWSYKAFRASLLPQVRLDINGPGILRSISQITLPNGNQTFIQQNQAFSNGSLSISQQIAPTGGSVFLSSGINRLDVFGTNSYVQYQARPILLGVQQPLFGFNSLRWNRKTQPLRYRLAEKRYLEALEDIAINIGALYFDVYMAQITLQNANMNVRVNDSIFAISKGRYNVGKIAENDLLQTELAYLNVQADQRQAETALLKAQTNLRISLGFSDDDQIVVLPPRDLPIVEVDAQFALEQAALNRSDIVDFQVRAVEAESAVARASSESRISANINATFGLNQSGANIPEAYTKPLDQQTATISLGIPIIQWGQAKAQVQSAKVEQSRVMEQIRLDQRRLERDVRFQVLDFEQMQAQMHLAAKADTIANRRYEVAKSRYLIGKIDITNMQIAQNEKDNARGAYVQALRQYWLAYFQLRRSTLFDFVESKALVPPDFTVD